MTEVINDLTNGGIDSADNLNSFFANQCEEQTVGGMKMCTNTGDAMATETECDPL